MIPMNVFFDSHEIELMDYFNDITLRGKSNDELKYIACTYLEAIVSKQSDLPKNNAPLSENLNNPFLLDQYLNYARFFDLWKDVLEPNKGALFDKIEEYYLAEKLSESEDLGCSSQATLKKSCESVKKELNRLYNACRACHEMVEAIVAELAEKPETFDSASISDYTRHIALTWSMKTRSLQNVHGIRSHHDWHEFHEFELESQAAEKLTLNPISETPTLDSENIDSRAHPSYTEYVQRRRSSLPDIYGLQDDSRRNYGSEYSAQHLPSGSSWAKSSYMTRDSSVPTSLTSQFGETEAQESRRQCEQDSRLIDKLSEDMPPIKTVISSSTSSSSTTLQHTVNHELYQPSPSSSFTSSNQRLPTWFKNWP